MGKFHYNHNLNYLPPVRNSSTVTQQVYDYTQSPLLLQYILNRELLDIDTLKKVEKEVKKYTREQLVLQFIDNVDPNSRLLIRNGLRLLHRDYLSSKSNLDSLQESLTNIKNNHSQIMDDFMLKLLINDVDIKFNNKFDDKGKFIGREISKEESKRFKSMVTSIMRDSIVKLDLNNTKYEDAGPIEEYTRQLKSGELKLYKGRKVEYQDLFGEIVKQYGNLLHYHHPLEVDKFADILLDRFKKGTPMEQIIKMARGDYGYGKDNVLLNGDFHLGLVHSGNYTYVPIKGGGQAVFKGNEFLYVQKRKKDNPKQYDYFDIKDEQEANFSLLNKEESYFNQILLPKQLSEFTTQTINDSGLNVIDINRINKSGITLENHGLRDVYKFGGRLILKKYINNFK